MTHYRAIHPIKLADGTVVPAGAELPPLEPRELVRIRQRGGRFAPVEERRRIVVVRAFRWGSPGAMRTAAVGEELIVEAGFARRMAWANAAKILGATTEPVNP